MGLSSTDRTAIFFRESMPIIKIARQRETLIMEVTHTKSSIQTVTFNLQGLTEKIAPLQKACRWE